MTKDLIPMYLANLSSINQNIDTVRLPIGIARLHWVVFKEIIRTQAFQNRSPMICPFFLKKDENFKGWISCMNAPLFHFEKRLDEESNGTNSGGRKIKEALSKKVFIFSSLMIKTYIPNSNRLYPSFNWTLEKSESCQKVKKIKIPDNLIGDSEERGLARKVFRTRLSNFFWNKIMLKYKAQAVAL